MSSYTSLSPKETTSKSATWLCGYLNLPFDLMISLCTWEVLIVLAGGYFFSTAIPIFWPKCKFRISELRPTNKGILCNTIPSVALVHTSIQSNHRMQTKEILSSRNSKQAKPQSCPETSTANSRLVRVEGDF